jgi:hypothetical protein
MVRRRTSATPCMSSSTASRSCSRLRTGYARRLDTDLRLCVCGCAESEHPDGRCRFCGPDQCAGFVFYADGSLDALIAADGDPLAGAEEEQS